MRGKVVLLALVFLTLSALAVGGNENRRVVDSPRTPSIRGGGKLNSAKRHLLQPDNLGAATTELLQGASAELPESYTLLLESKYERCYFEDLEGQGYSCNSCWAFAVQKMMQARRCKTRIDANLGDAIVPLTPLNLVCHIQVAETQEEMCRPRSVFDALEYAKETGILREAWIKDWRRDLAYRAVRAARENYEMRGSISDMGVHLAHTNRNRENRRDTVDQAARHDIVTWARADSFASTVLDVSMPKPDKCNMAFEDNSYQNARVSAQTIRFSTAPHTTESLKRRLLFGPVIATLRLSWEFQIFTGSLFNPSGIQTFCRMAKATDTNDYCDPAKRSSWDSEQRSQQVRPRGTDREAWEETWYNHFVTLHGWGVKKSTDGTSTGVPYWVVENSWGRIYDNDVSLGNNGAGRFYSETVKDEDGYVNEFKYNLHRKNHFVMIADRVAGSGGLEFTSREVYSAGF